MVVEILSMVGFLSFIVEKVVEYFIASPLEAWKGKDWKYRKATLLLSSLVVSVPLTVCSGLDLIEAFANGVSYDLPSTWGNVGVVTTAVLIAGGSNILSAIQSKFFSSSTEKPLSVS